MDRETPDLIEQEMQQTRSSLTEKVAALEQTVMGTLQNATEAVSTTVDQVKSVVQDTLTSVKDTAADVKHTVADSVQTVTEKIGSAFDLATHTREHPWAMVGGAGLAGFLTGLLFGGRSSGSYRPASEMPTLYTSAASQMAAIRQPQPAPAPTPSRRPAWLDDLLEWAGLEIRKLGQEAVGVVVASARQSLHTQVPRLIDSFTGRTGEPAGVGHPRTSNGAGRV
jgi:ElaB/YqjD/DUF883 family membrane-anchored ribosome-binding protein